MKANFRTAIQTGGSATLVGEFAEGLLRACEDEDPEVQVQTTLKMIAERCQKSRKISRGGNNRGGKSVRKPPKGENVKERVKKFRSPVPI